MDKRGGKVIIPSNAKPWPHERRVADILASHGYIVEFIPENNVTRSADILLDGSKYEIKSPVSNKLAAVERNLKRGIGQSRQIIFDSSRMKDVRDSQIIRILAYQLKKHNNLKKVIFINRSKEVIDVSKRI